MIRIALAALGLPALAFAADGATPLMGDVQNGARLYRVHCASCHGMDKSGNGPLAEAVGKVAPIPDLADPAVLLRYDDPALAAFLGKGAPPAMPPFEQALSVLDTQDLIAFLRDGMVKVSDYWPATAKYTAKIYTLDSYAAEKVEKATSDKVTEAEKQMLILVGFLGEIGQDGPEMVPQDPRLLDQLPWKRKSGYLAFVPVPFEKKTYSVGMALDTDGFIAKINTTTGTPAERAKLDAMLKAFEGLGGRNAAKKPLEVPKSAKVKPTPQVIKAVSRGFWRAIGAMGLHDKEERDRHMFDADFGDASMEAGEMETKKKK